MICVLLFDEQVIDNASCFDIKLYKIFGGKKKKIWFNMKEKKN